VTAAETAKLKQLNKAVKAVSLTRLNFKNEVMIFIFIGI